MDAISSFSHIVDNLPAWRDQVLQLSTYTTQKHKEFKAEYNRLVSKAKPKRIKSPSVCSIHTENDAEAMEVDNNDDSQSTPPNLAEISPFEAGNRYIYAQTNKKRKPGTSFRSGASGPMKFRSKQMVVIYYDSFVQDQLDALVKAIGGSRNNLRKGKMAYTVSRGLRLPSLLRRNDLAAAATSHDGAKASGHRGSLRMSQTKSDTKLVVDDSPTGEAAFRQTDKDLETCQNLCETAAHQFLRDGDCSIELDTVVRNLDQVLVLARSTLEAFKAEEMKEETVSEDASMAGSTNADSEATLVEKPSRELLSAHHKMYPRSDEGSFTRRPMLPNISSAPPATTEIEVDDDSDQSSIEIDISKYRTNRAGVRT